MIKLGNEIYVDLSGEVLHGKIVEEVFFGLGGVCGVKLDNGDVVGVEDYDIYESYDAAKKAVWDRQAHFEKKSEGFCDYFWLYSRWANC